MFNYLIGKQKNLKREGVKKMRRLCTLIGVVSMMLMVCPSIASATDPVTSQLGDRIIHITYNSFGVALSQTITTNMVITTVGDLYFWDANGDGVYNEGDIVLTREEEVDPVTGEGLGTYKYYYLVPDGDDADSAMDKVYKDMTLGEGGSRSTTYQTTVQTSTWQNGSLRLSTVATNSSTYLSAAGGEAILVSTSNTVDTYSYDESGNLLGVTGGGSYTSYSTFINAEGEQTRYMSGAGSISNTYEIRNGQALLRSTVRVGDVFAYDVNDVNPDGDVVDVGDFISIEFTGENEFEYLGGQWVPMVSHSQSLQVSHAEQAGGAIYKTGITLADTIATAKAKVDAANADDVDNNDISYVSRTESTTTYTRNGAGVITGMSMSYAPMSNPADFRTAANWQMSITGLSSGTPAVNIWVLDTAKSSATFEFDAERGWYLKEETQVWKYVANPDWNSGTWGDPAATGRVYQGADGKWYMNVQVWSNAEKTEYATITIELNLDALSAESRAALVEVLQQYAASGELLTLYGLSANDVLSQGAKLVVMGLGKGEFAAHPFDFTDEQPANFRPATENYAQFVVAMQNSPYWRQIFGGLSADTRAITLKELYNTLITGGLKIGGSFTTSRGLTFNLVAERNGGARLTCSNHPEIFGIRHFTNELCKELGLR